jgi:predicted MFS family arabinose efflux permease
MVPSDSLSSPDPASAPEALAHRPARHLGSALVTVALLGAVIGSLGAPLITPVATAMGVSLAAAQWTLTITLFSGVIAGPVLGRWGAGPRRRTAILVALGLVALGGVLTATLLSFPVLLVGRGLQGVGLGVVALLMSVARDHLPAHRSASTIAMLAVASTVGIGVGYPLVGLLDQVAGLRTAYALGLVLSVVSFAVAWRAVPDDQPRAQPRVDVAGAVLLGVGTLGILLVIAEPGVWSNPWLAVAIIVIAVALLCIWGVIELRITAPLVDLRLLAHAPVLRANAAMLVSGAGMYLLFSLLTRYLQTPADAGYGFGLSGVAAAAALIPFSVLGFVAGRLIPGLVDRLSPRRAYTTAAIAVMVAAVLFASVPDALVAVLTSMAILGLGVGGVSAVMPRLVLGGVPPVETASVLSINQIGRSIGFSVGSALAGLLLAAATPSGALVPVQHGYVTAALWVLPFLVGSLLVVPSSRPRSG